MVRFLSNWTKNLGLAIVTVSIIEMLLPNNKIKKYIKTVLGTYILFCIISPFVQNKIDLNNLNLEEYVETSVSTEIDNDSMNRRIEELYKEELEKDITKKVTEKGYKVKNCNVYATVTQNVENTKIEKIVLEVEQTEENSKDKENIEDKLVSEIQKIKKVDTTIEKDNKKSESENKITETQKKELKKFLKEEYQVDEKNLSIN